MEDVKKWFTPYPEAYTHDIHIEDISLFDMLKETAERYPAHTATRMYQHTLTYQELYHSVRVFAGALQKKGLKKEIV